MAAGRSLSDSRCLPGDHNRFTLDESAGLAHDVEDVIDDDVRADVHQDQVRVDDAVFEARRQWRQDVQYVPRHG